MILIVFNFVDKVSGFMLFFENIFTECYTANIHPQHGVPSGSLIWTAMSYPITP